MKNRTVIGIVCIVLALALCFGAAPLVNKFSDERREIVRLKSDVPRGHAIAEADVETVTVGAYNLPSNLITDKTAVVGMYAACDLKSGDYLLPGKLTSESDSANDIFRTLDGSMTAISITIQSFAAGLSGKLENGDIVSLAVHSDDSGEAVIPPELCYVRVITSTTAEGFDKDELTPNEDGAYELPTTLTLLVSPRQAKLLVGYENEGNIHAILVYRGEPATAQTFIDEQDEYLETHPEPSEEEMSEAETSEAEASEAGIVSEIDEVNGNG